MPHENRGPSSEERLRMALSAARMDTLGKTEVQNAYQFTPFEVGLLAAGDGPIAGKMATAVGGINSMAAGETKTVDIRLPIEALQLGRDANGRYLAFSVLYAVVDSQNTVAEVDDGQERNNNVYAWKIGDIRPVDLTMMAGTPVAPK